MTRASMIAWLLAGSAVLGSFAAQAQNDGAPPNANASSATAVVTRPPSTSSAVASSSATVQLAGSGGETQEPVPMAPTTDNRVNNPPVSNATGTSSSGANKE